MIVSAARLLHADTHALELRARENKSAPTREGGVALR